VKKIFVVALLLALPAIAQELETLAPKVSVVMSGLDNPRGLAFGPEGALYVAEAGRGGAGPCIVRLLRNFCYGPSGAVKRLWKGNVETVVSGLPSIAAPSTAANPGNTAQGPDGIGFHGRGNLFVAIGWEDDPRKRALLGEEFTQFGRLIKVTPDGETQLIADIGDYQTSVNLINPDTDPFHVVPQPNGELVIDSGANELLRVNANGDISHLAHFYSRVDGRSTDSVPTSVVEGPDGAYYVSELTGIPFPNSAGLSNVYRFYEGEEPQKWLTGFTNVIDLAFDSLGNLYVLQHGPLTRNSGALKRVELHGCTTMPDLCPRTTLLDKVDKPTAIVVGPNDEIYMSVKGIFEGGEVWKVEP
jgi:hypothetical protein